MRFDASAKKPQVELGARIVPRSPQQNAGDFRGSQVPRKFSRDLLGTCGMSKSPVSPAPEMRLDASATNPQVDMDAWIEPQSPQQDAGDLRSPQVPRKSSTALLGICGGSGAMPRACSVVMREHQCVAPAPLMYTFLILEQSRNVRSAEGVVPRPQSDAAWGPHQPRTAPQLKMSMSP